MGAIAVVVGAEGRRRWRRIVALTLLVGVLGALVLATAAGARRTSTALARFKASSRAADVELAVSATPEQLAAFRRTPGIAALATMSAVGVLIPQDPTFQSTGVPDDAEFGVSVDRDRIVAGRAPDVDAVDEVTLGEGLAGQLGLRVGDRFDVVSYTPEQIAAFLALDPTIGAPAGPRVALRLVGIVRRPLDLGDRGASGGLMVLTPAFGRTYAGRIGVFGTRVRVRTVDEVTDVPAVLAAARRIFGDSLFSAQSLTVDTQGARAAIDLFASGLWITVGVAALAGVAVLGLILAREVGLVLRDGDRLRQLGFTRGQVVGAGVAWATPIAVGGAVLAVVGATALSPLFPLGIARRADPDIGLHADRLVLGLGGSAVAVVVLVMVAASGRRLTAHSRDALGPAHASRLVQGTATLGLPPAVTTGVRLAVDPERRRGVLAPGAALAGAVGGVLAIVAALVFVASERDLVDTPARYGPVWDFSVTDLTSSTPCGGDAFGVPGVSGVRAVTEICTQNVELDGRSVTALAYSPLTGVPLPPAITDGRAPVAPDEIALGAKTLRALGKRIGDTVRASRRTISLDFRIVGTAVFPTLTQSQPLADGAALTWAGYGPLFDGNIYFRSFVGRIAPGTDLEAVAAALAGIPQISPLATPRVPVEIDRLRQIGWLPAALAGLVGGLALLAVGHALVNGVRRQRRTLALLKTLGFTRRQVRAAVAWQATTIGAIGLLIGVPAGVITGRLIWQRVADDLGVSVTSVVPVLAALAAAPATMLVVNLVAYLPGRAASRARPATVLRAE